MRRKEMIRETRIADNFSRNFLGGRIMTMTSARKLAVIAAMLIISAGTIATVRAQSVMIDDFEKGERGWSGYSDREDIPKTRLTDETVSGDKAMEVTLNGCKSYQGLHLINASALPKNAVAISFLIKPISGVPPIAITLENTELKMKTDTHTAVALGVLSLKGTDWQKVKIPFSSLIYGSGPNQDKPYPALTPGAVYTVRFYGPVVDNPSVFLLHDVKWETN